MRHPLLRILVAFFIGVVSPLCCCQAMALAGSGCGERHAAAATPESCCGACSGGPESDDTQNAPADDGNGVPGKCPSCPSCQGSSVGAGVKVDSKVPAFDDEWNALATIALVTLWTSMAPVADGAPTLPSWFADPPHLKANREALRWHCALVV